MIVRILLSLAICLSAGTSFFTRRKAPDKAMFEHLLLLGHRGLPKAAPENTLASFALAMKAGADGVEFDVHLSKDQVPVVIHDDTLERTTGKKGEVKEFTAAELSRFNAGHYKNVSNHEPIPTLAQVLERLPDRAVVNIELKSAGDFSAVTLIKRVDEVVQKHRNRLRFILSSFDGDILRAARRQGVPDVLGVIVASNEEHWPSILFDMLWIRPDSIHMPRDMPEKWLVDFAHFFDTQVLVWTVNNIEEAQRLKAIGVDGVFSDDVRDIVRVVKSSI